MADSPTVHVPLDSSEQPILDKLLALRDALMLLKQDKSTYVKSPDVVGLYDQVITQVCHLNQIRENKTDEQNRVDSVLDDCFQLISLFFMTIGRNNEAPAVYAFTSTIKRLLDHLGEANYYSEKDLQSITVTIGRMRTILGTGKQDYAPQLVTLLEARLANITGLLAERRKKFENMPPGLLPTYEKLISILRSMAAANTKQTFPAGEVKHLRQQWLDIQSKLVDGEIVDPDGKPYEGQNLVKSLLDSVAPWMDVILERQGKIDEKFQDVYEKLREIRNQLDKLSLTQAWALRETDLYSFQRELDKHDAARVNGDFVDASGQPAEVITNRTLLYLLRRSYAYIYILMLASEPVSEALQPIYNQLQTLKRCLVEVQRSGGVSSPRELYPYSMKLNSIDNLRVDGKFLVGTDIPEGQASVNALLAECYDISYELRVAAEQERDDVDEAEIKIDRKDSEVAPEITTESA
ncbi:MAG: hypothetical protein M1814_000456 [Vezdaea aestivalis]|nr:MAG: hypothetical protein M1814_000456 [Vezdaea aestivalis]